MGSSEDWAGDFGEMCDCPQCGHHTTERDLGIRGVCSDCWNEGQGWPAEGWELSDFPPQNPKKWEGR